MAQGGGWVPYAGAGAVLLAVILLAITGLIAFLGSRIRNPIGLKGPGKAGGVLMVMVCGLSILSFDVAELAYIVQLVQEFQKGATATVSAPTNPITPLTFGSAAVTFVLIAYLTRKHGVKIALLSAFVGTAAAPMIFELPFDLIVISRTIAIPPSPELYRLLFFLPLFVVEVSTISLLTLSPLTRVTKYTAYSLAGMFLVFAIWALIGFEPPIEFAPIFLNSVSKILCFVTSITLFVTIGQPAALPAAASLVPAETP